MWCAEERNHFSGKRFFPLFPQPKGGENHLWNIVIFELPWPSCIHQAQVLALFPSRSFREVGDM
jgi:hypothetical protein